MRKSLTYILGVVLISALGAGTAFAQAEGTITGSVRDPDGGPLPGVSVTVTGPILLGARTVVTGPTGGYSFPRLAASTYDLKFELSGFATLIREGIILPTARTMTVDVIMRLATVEETITVTGESPMVDVKTTDVGASYTADQIAGVPTATDIWSVLAMTENINMRAYDVGGSHKSQQLNYDAAGLRRQARVMTEGLDSTEGTGGTGFYFDIFANSDVQIRAAATDVEMGQAGVFIVQNTKTGGNEYTGSISQTFEDDSFVRDNITDDLRSRAFTGNPNLQFRETHLDAGGPVSKANVDKLWFFGTFNSFRIDKEVSGIDPQLATDIGEFFVYSGKVNWKATSKDEIIGFAYWQLKEKPQRGLSSTVAPESVLGQASWSRMWKGEWQRTWSDNLYSEMVSGVMGFTWPMVPKVDPAIKPPNRDLITGQATGAGTSGGLLPFFPFTFRRYKPQSRGTAFLFEEGAGGTHDLKFGYDFMIDSAQLGQNLNSGPFVQRTREGVPSEVLLTNKPLFPDDRDRHFDIYGQDSFTFANRVTFTGGIRFSRQRLYNKSTTVRPFLTDFFEAGDNPPLKHKTFDNISPRGGLAIDVLGDGKAVAKVSWGRFYENVADRFSNLNPAGQQSKLFVWNDINNNLRFDGPSELGDLISTQGGGGVTALDPGINNAYTDEITASGEVQFWDESSVRVGYVKKRQKDFFDTIDFAREGKLTVPFQAVDPGPDGLTGTGDDGVLNLLTVPPELLGVSDNLLTNFQPRRDYDNLELSFRKRVRRLRNTFVRASYTFQWRSEMQPASSSQSPLNARPLFPGYFLNLNPNVSSIQDSTLWDVKFTGHTQLPYDIGFAVNASIGSGFNFAQQVSVNGGFGTRRVFNEDIDNNRSDTVYLVNMRGEREFTLPSGQSILAFADVFNIFNESPELNFIQRSGSRFNQIIQALDPLTLQLGIRYVF
ncbi:MAG: carboxypeptidase regulatory-like domain-containing protein [Acidobacteriota bacterium]